MSQFPQHNFHNKIHVNGKRNRLTSFSLIKKITYENEERAEHARAGLEELKRSTFHERIVIPYFEYEIDGCELTYQAEYIKGNYVTFWDMPILREAFLERENPWTFVDISPVNYIVDSYHPGIHHDQAPIYPVDLDSYGYWPERRHRVETWNRIIQRQRADWSELLIDEDPA